MAKIIVITSGKGGVGKTTTSASIATGIALYGYKTIVIDFDIGLRNLDLIMGCERRVIYDFINVINGEVTLHQAIIKDKRIANLFILPTSQTKDKESLTFNGVEKVLNDLSNEFDYIICDSPAGIETGALMAMYFSDYAIVVINPEISSIRDADRILGLLSSKTKRAIENKNPIQEFLLITRYDQKRVTKGEMLSISDIKEILGIPIIGIIPESKTILKSSNTGIPIILNKKSNASIAYQDTVDRFFGKNKPFKFVKNKKKGILYRLFGKIGIY
ncbi:septum site-determining protein MinD [Candidatus Legionella polyplacis]|uniref:Septum site-determining protein MinD n=1 Tax=Candidatus Legionella polyplacis TaxID=2005262 RepID=A0ABZ2GWI3_9GAMM|nr:septum site-determining protein MinD [Candidatus Legionella polyplacis]ATW01993.1 septum site-determining protein MinD [Candidatus Legionella polyplacis]